MQIQENNQILNNDDLMTEMMLDKSYQKGKKNMI